LLEKLKLLNIYKLRSLHVRLKDRDTLRPEYKYGRPNNLAKDRFLYHIEM